MKAVVYWNKQYGQYHARIYTEGRYIHVGRYGSEEEAVLMADAKIIELSAPKKSPKQLWSERAKESHRRIMAKYRSAT